DSNTGQYFVQCGNFHTPWNAGDILQIDVDDGLHSNGSVQVELTYMPVDQADTIILISRIKQIRIGTEPPGLSFIIDDTLYNDTHTFNWYQDTRHAFSVQSTQQKIDGVRYLFSSWNTGNIQDHIYTVPHYSETLTINFGTQYYLSVESPFSQVSGEGWYDRHSDAEFSIDTTLLVESDTRYIFKIWSGTGSNSYSGLNPVYTIFMESPIIQRALWEIQYIYKSSSFPEWGGTIDPGMTDVWVRKDSAFTVQAIPNTENDCLVSRWTGDIQG
ncbi:hypothetical protein BVY01_01035, partial [bacterium I07]